MTIRVNMDHWPDGDRALTKRIAALTIEPLGEHSFAVTARDHKGDNREVIVDGWQWNASHPWRLIAEALRMLEEVK